MDHLHPNLKHGVDVTAALIAAFGLSFSTIASGIASVAAAVWYGCRIYDWYKARKDNHGDVRIN